MIEKFTDEELAVIRKELAEKDKSDKPREKPYDVYHPEVSKLFKDRPFPIKESHRSGDVADHVLECIDRISAFTLDCVEIKDSTFKGGVHPCKINHNLGTKMLSKIPIDTYKEYCLLWEDMISVIEKHIKPYTRFLDEKSYSTK